MKRASRICCALALVLAQGGAIVVSAAEKAETAQATTGELRLEGILQAEGKFVVFVTRRGEEATRELEALGARVGPWTLVAVDAAKGYADFRREAEPPVRVWLREGVLREGDSAGPDGRVAIPALPLLKGVVGLEEAIAALPRTAEMKMKITLDRIVNQEGFAPEERLKRLAELRSGSRRHIVIPKSGVDAAFAAKYGLTPGEVAYANALAAEREAPGEPPPRTSFERQ